MDQIRHMLAASRGNPTDFMRQLEEACRKEQEEEDARKKPGTTINCRTPLPFCKENVAVSGNFLQAYLCEDCRDFLIRKSPNLNQARLCQAAVIDEEERVNRCLNPIVPGTWFCTDHDIAHPNFLHEDGKSPKYDTLLMKDLKELKKDDDFDSERSGTKRKNREEDSQEDSQEDSERGVKRSKNE